MVLLSACHKLPDHKMYWETSPNTFVQARSDSMPRNTLEHILWNLHLCDNKQHDISDKFSKLFPVINEPNRRFSVFC